MKVCCLPLYVGSIIVSTGLVLFTQVDASGARALYLLDFDGTNLPGLKNTIGSLYPDVRVSLI